MLDAKTEARLSKEHFDKYEALAKHIGIENLIPLIPATPEEIRHALDRDDEDLNTVALVKWDHAVGYGDKGPQVCACCGQRKPYKASDHSFRLIGPFRCGKPLSPAECVCVLKHVARYHYAPGR